MILSDTEIRAAYYATAELVRRRRRTGAPIPDAVRWFFDRLDRAIRDGPESAKPEDVPHQDGIGTGLAAAILGIPERQVRRIAADLEGTRIGRDWVFSRAAVEEYAAARHER